MTKQNITHKLTRPLVITLLTAVAIPALMSAPSAYAGEKNKVRNSNNTYQSDRARDKSKAQRHNKSNVQRERRAQRQNKPNVQRERKAQRRDKSTAQRKRNWRNDRRQNRGDWSNDRERQHRLDRAERTQRANRTQRASNDQRRNTRQATNRTQRRNDRHNTNRTHRDNNWRNNRSHRSDTRRNQREHRRNDRSHRRSWERSNDRYWRRNARRSNRRDYRRERNYRPFRYTSHRGYRTNYRSSFGINFFFGQAGYSRYRWAPTRYSFYRPGYVSYNSYQSRTRCERILIDGYHDGHEEIVSVLKCSNPYDGSYIVQGTEQVVECFGGDPYYDDITSPVTAKHITAHNRSPQPVGT